MSLVNIWPTHHYDGFMLRPLNVLSAALAIYLWGLVAGYSRTEWLLGVAAYCTVHLVVEQIRRKMIRRQIQMQALLIGEKEREQVNEIVRYAEKNLWYDNHIKALMSGEISVPAENSSHACILPHSFKCVFTIEQHKAGQWFKHLSVSCWQQEKWVAPHIVQEIMGMFGMGRDLTDERTTVYPEREVGNKNSFAVNVMTAIDPPAGAK